MTVNAEIFVAKKENVLMLPVEAIQQKDGKSFVIPVREENGAYPGNNNKKGPAPIEMIEVKTGISNDEYIEILSGLNEGDMVLVPTSSNSSIRVQGMMGPMPGSGGAPGGAPVGGPGPRAGQRGGQSPRR